MEIVTRVQILIVGVCVLDRFNTPGKWGGGCIQLFSLQLLENSVSDWTFLIWYINWLNTGKTLNLNFALNLTPGNILLLLRLS